jgi:hypothetical protein
MIQLKSGSISNSKRFGKHAAAFHLALVLSIAGTSSGFAQTGLPALPELPSYPTTLVAPGKSLPIVYPFESREKVRQRTTGRLLAILGLRKSETSALPSDLAESALPKLPSSPPMQSSNHSLSQQQVVPATAESEEPETLYSDRLYVGPAAEIADVEVGLSLIDIDVPIEDESSSFQISDDSHSATEGTAAAGSVSENDRSTPPALTPATLTPRMPTLLKDSKSMALRIEAPKLRSTEVVQEVSQRRVESKTPSSNVVESTSFSFSDEPDEPDNKVQLSVVNETVQNNFSDKQPESRGVSLHRSSATPTSSVVALAPAKPKAMKISIEGAPALVISKTAIFTATPNENLIAAEPIAAEPIATEPIATEPIATEPIATEPIAAEPIAAGSIAVSQPATSTNQPQKLRASLASLVRSSNAEESYEQLDSREEAPDLAPLKYGPAIPVQTQDTTTVILDSTIMELSIEHPQVCQLIQTGNRTFSLIGLQTGSTRIALVTTGADDKRMVEIREVVVSGASTTPTDQHSLAKKISSMVSKLYPNSDVNIVPIDGNLLVEGIVDSEAEAKKVLAFVRKTSLAPVIDRLRSSER